MFMPMNGRRRRWADRAVEGLENNKIAIILSQFIITVLTDKIAGRISPFHSNPFSFIFYWYKLYIWLLEQNEDTWSSSISGSDTEADVCDVDDEELERSELFIKVLQSFPASSLPAHTNASLVDVVKEILGHHIPR